MMYWNLEKLKTGEAAMRALKVVALVLRHLFALRAESREECS